MPGDKGEFSDFALEKRSVYRDTARRAAQHRRQRGRGGCGCVGRGRCGRTLHCAEATGSPGTCAGSGSRSDSGRDGRACALAGRECIAGCAGGLAFARVAMRGINVKNVLRRTLKVMTVRTYKIVLRLRTRPLFREAAPAEFGRASLQFGEVRIRFDTECARFHRKALRVFVKQTGNHRAGRPVGRHNYDSPLLRRTDLFLFYAVAPLHRPR
jgi:hypothetical protein